MNFRKLITYLTMGTAAAMPLAVAQNPTILQGSYISNVFGNSNFIKNPNAQTNIADVTVSNATVTRSTTTPLVATSEFNITTSTSTGYADWSTRTFDAGMKGQNCEARFTYRGFSVGSTTAQILQGANVVAQLTLTASTDPRIASINFPCGDLSSATTFRLQQATASLTGTNEIGGIYVGLATNMANVAQAEVVGGYNITATGVYPQTTSATYANLSLGTSTLVPFGQATSVNAASGSVTFANLPPGNYVAVYTSTMISSTSTACQFQWYEDTSGQQSGFLYNFNDTSWSAMDGFFQFTTSGSRTFRVRAKRSSGSGICGLDPNLYAQMIIKRFPSSSELVVTPERQNVFAAAQWPGSSDFSTTTVQTNTKINTTNFGTPTGIGKAQVTSLTDCGLAANDIGFCVKNVPAGNYKVAGNLVFGQTGGGYCSVNTNVSGSSLSATKVAQAFAFSATASQDWTSVGTGYINIPSFQSYVAVYFTLSVDTTATCNIRSANAANKHTAQPTLTFEPLDQPSNSALYVQGPVKAAETGAAIPAGYVGEIVPTVSSTVTLVAGGSYRTGTGITLQPGMWDVEIRVSAGNTAPTEIEVGITDTINTAPIIDSRNFDTLMRIDDFGNTCCVLYGKSRGVFLVTTAKTYYPTIRAFPGGSSFNYVYNITAHRLN